LEQEASKLYRLASFILRLHHLWANGVNRIGSKSNKREIDRLVTGLKDEFSFDVRPKLLLNGTCLP
jgi:hypothetical protein